MLSYGQQNFTVSTFAGNDTLGKDTAGFRNGLDSITLFNGPGGIAADTMGNIYVADTRNNVIRKIAKDSVTTFAGSDTAGYKDGIGTAAKFRMPLGICTDRAGNVYIADTYNNVIREISPLGNVITFAGNDTAGYRDGAASKAEFHLPVGVAADKFGNIYVADNGNQVIRKISNDTVTTLAGNTTPGCVNGTANASQFYGLYGIAVDTLGNVFVTEYMNNDVREVSGGMVSTLAAGYDSLHQPGTGMAKMIQLYLITPRA